MGNISALRSDTFATGTPTLAGYVPPYSEPFSFIGHHSLINTPRAANSTLRDFVAASTAEEIRRVIGDSPLGVPRTSMNRDPSDGRLPQVPLDDASLRGL